MPKRGPDALRAIAITPHYLTHPEGSALISWGDTKVICTASVEEKVPPWLANKGRGWVTAEYDMLPRATGTRKGRDAKKGAITGRTQEISRLIGRALRAVVSMEKLGERMLTVDCDVIQADGGTRTAAITGGYVALALAIQHLQASGQVSDGVLIDSVAAVSVGVVEGQAQLDLDYMMDSMAHVDMNVVMTGTGNLVEVQGTGEQSTFGRDQLDTMLDYALGALPTLTDLQTRAVSAPRQDPPATISARSVT